MTASLSDRIRAVLARGPNRVADISEELGECPVRVRNLIGRMVCDGMVQRLVRHRPGRVAVYALGRPAKVPARLDPAERHRRLKAHHVKWQEIRKARNASRARPKSGTPAKPAPKRRPEAQQPRVKDRAPYQARDVATAPARECLPDSTTWRGPIEVLPPGEVSPESRLRHDYRRQA
jgi:hypothetical protein